jgi:purine-binding chemotaxis protein CheW
MRDSSGELEVRRRIAVLERELVKLRRLETAEQPSADPWIGILICDIGPYRLAFAVHDVLEVLPIARTMPIPDAPYWVLGFLNLRGVQVPVADVRGRFERRKRRPGLDERIVVCRGEEGVFGLLVTGIVELRSFERRELAAPSGELRACAWVRGVLTLADRPILLVLPDALERDLGLDELLRTRPT